MTRFYLILFFVFTSIFILSACSNENSKYNVYTGTIEATTIYIQSEISGRITNLYVNEGDRIKKGDKIAQLDVRQYEEQAKAAKAALEIAKLKYDDVKNASTTESNIAKLNLEQAEAAFSLANLAVEKGTITSPIDGTITAIYSNPGEMASPGGNIAQLSDLDNLWVKIYIPEKYLYKVSLNKEVSIKVDPLSYLIKGKITYISSSGEFTPKNTATKSAKEDIVYEVKIQILNHVKDLKPGMLADISI